MNYSRLPATPLYDPGIKIRSFKYEEDWSQMYLYYKAKGGVFTDSEFFFDLDEKLYEWKRVPEISKNPKFVDNHYSKMDALQGIQGDCWFVAAVIATTRVPGVLDHIAPPDQNFTYNYFGAFHFRFWRLGTWYDVVVDDRLPVWKNDQTLCYAHSRSGNVFWAALLEKAYAKFYTRGNLKASYSILEGGVARTALLDLTGGIVELEIIPKLLSGTTLKKFLTLAYYNGAIMCFHCYKEPQNTKGIMAYHTYSLTRVFIGSGPAYDGLYLIRIMNPWGNTEWQGRWSDDDFDMWKQIDRNIRNDLGVTRQDDGEFWMDDEDLVKIFDAISISFLNPGHYLTSRSTQKVLGGWKNVTFKGEWVKDVSAGGSNLVTRHMNPQFKIELDLKPLTDAYHYGKDGELLTVTPDGYLTVLIDLVHMSKVDRKLTPDIACFIYFLKNPGYSPLPLNQRYLNYHYPLEVFPDYISSYGRSYQKTIQLKPGTYVLIPCTKNEDEESQFLLRVFAENVKNYWVYDHQLSKSLEVAKTNLCKFDEDLYEAFKNVKEEDYEIDWIGLKGILDAMFSKSNLERGLFGYVMAFFRYIEDLFTQIASDNYDTAQRFSKDDCRRMITMLDSDRSGKLDFSELCNLWKKLKFWAEVYENHKNDTNDTEAYISVAQLRDALSAMGFNVSKQIIHSLSYHYADDQGKIVLTDFILCGITLETVLASSQKFDKGSGIFFSLDEWVKCSLNL